MRQCRVSLVNTLAAVAVLLGATALAGQQAASAAAESTCPVPSGGQLQGIDVSSQQHPKGVPISWPEVASCGYRFAFVKVSEGSYYPNPYFQADLAGAETAGLLAAPYQLAIPNYSGGTLQADYAINNAGVLPNGMTLPLVVDLEPDPYVNQDHTNSCYGLSSARMVSWIRAFVLEADRRTGQLPIIYTSASWWNKCTGRSTAFGTEPLWVAEYGVSAPALPAGWASYTYWQYSASGTVTGIANQVDADYFNDAAMQLAAPGTQSDAAGSTVQLHVNTLNAAAGQQLSYAATGLPAGLTIDPATGLISGQLGTTPATAHVTVTASGTGGPAGSASFGWQVHGQVTVSAVANQASQAGAPVRLQLHAADGLSGCSLTFSAAGLPRGLSVSRCGLITGWLQAPGSSAVTVSVSDSSGAVLGTTTFRWHVGAASRAAQPAGQIRLQAGGKCLDRLTASRVGTWRCDRRGSERWRIGQDGTLTAGGSCLTAPGTGSSGAVKLAGCDGSTAQQWQPGSGTTLISVAAGRCLAADSGGDGATVQLAACGTRPARQWRLPAGPVTSGLPGWCAGRNRAGQVVLRRCGTRAALSWTGEPDQTIRAGGRCLTVTGSATAAGRKVTLAACRHAAGQIWHLAGGPIGAQLINPHAGLCLSVPADRRAAGTRLALGYCVSADPGTSWRVS